MTTPKQTCPACRRPVRVWLVRGVRYYHHHPADADWTYPCPRGLTRVDVEQTPLNATTSGNGMAVKECTSFTNR